MKSTTLLSLALGLACLAAANAKALSPAETCAPWQHQCSDGSCYDKTPFLCNSRPDCPDASDETNCPPEPTEPTEMADPHTCFINSFRCANGKCIPNEWTCDTQNDCGDWSDETVEAQCTPATARPCENGTFDCPNGHGVWSICGSARCDGRQDCAMHGDENNCQSCKGDTLHCDNRRCVERARVCDGHDDCGDLSDERDCPGVHVFTGRRVRPRCGGFTCRSGHCLGTEYRCDGFNDCGDWSDEVGCAERQCDATTEFECPHMGMHQANGTHVCVPLYTRCDGDAHCADGADERDCDSCGDYGFHCANRNCVNFYSRCDGKNDCGDGSDERDCTILTEPRAVDPFADYY